MMLILSFEVRHAKATDAIMRPCFARPKGQVGGRRAAQYMACGDSPASDVRRLFHGYWTLLAAFLCNIVTFGCGRLCDRIQAKHALAIGLVLQVVSILILMSIGDVSPAWMAWDYTVTMGLGIGSWLPTMSMLVSGGFDHRHHGSIFRAVTTPQSVGSAVGTMVAGMTREATTGSSFSSLRSSSCQS